MKYMKPAAGWATALLALSLAGCSQQNNSAIQGVSKSDAAQLNSAHSTFESSEDPPIKADTHFAAGEVAESQGNMDVAIEQYQEALKVQPKHLAAMYRLGVLYAQQKQFSEAIDMWNRYVKATDESAGAWGDLAFCYELAGRPAEAETAYQKGIAKDPKNRPCRTNYGLMLARHNRVNEAMLQWQAVLTPAEVHYNLASVYEMQHRKEEAKVEYQKAIDLDPKFAEAKTRLSGLN